MQASEHLQAIIANAESTAHEIIDQAEGEARRYVEEVRKDSDREVASRAVALSELSDSLIEHAQLLKRRSQELLDSIERASEPVATNGSALPDEPSFDQVPEPGVVSEPRFGGETDSALPENTALPELDDDSERYSAGARLLATQMAVAGSSVEDVRNRLVNDFGIADPQPLLDLVFGPV